MLQALTWPPARRTRAIIRTTDMIIYWLEAQPWNPVTNAAVTLRATSIDIAQAVQLDHDQAEWLPVLKSGPTTQMSVFDGAAIQASRSTFGKIDLLAGDEAIDHWVGYQWAQRPITIYAATIDLSNPAAPVFPATKAALTVIFQGEIDTYDADKATLTLSIKQPSGKVASASYAGTGGMEGPVTLKGVVKPWASGEHFNRAPTLVDSGLQLYQWHGYGPSEELTNVRERGIILDQTRVTHANAAALLAATVQPTEIHVCLAVSAFRIGFTPVAEITCDFKGDNTGGYSARLGSIVKRLMTGPAGLALASIDTSTLTNLDSDIPHNAWCYDESGTDVVDVLNQLLAPVGAYWDVDEATGEFYVGLFRRAGAVTFEVGDDRGEQLIGNPDILPTRPPFWKNRIGYLYNPTVLNFEGFTSEVWQLLNSKGKVTYGGPLPSAANSSVGDLHVGDDGTFYERVGGGGILLDGKVVVLAGYRPVLPWTLTASQPLRDTIATANEAYSNANDAIDQLIGLADDGIISINEKITKLIPEQARLNEKYTVLAGQATGLAVSTTAAAAAKATWDAMLAGLSPAWNNVTADSPVVRATFDAARNGFDSALYDLDAAIKTKAATIANWSGIADDNGNRPDDNATRNRMRGNYSGIATYAPGDTVLWLVADGGTGTGFTRIGSGDTSGVNPADATKWMPFAEEGQDGSLMIRETLPAFDTVKVGQKVMLADGLIYRRVGSGGILLGGKVVVLAGYRPVLPWTLESTQPVAAGIRYGLQAIDEAQAAQASADLANAAIANIDDDAIITISEKVETLIPGASAFAALYTAVAANAAVAGISMTTLNSKRTAWLAALAAVSPAWNDVSQASPVTRNALDTARNEYDAELKETQRLAIEAMTAAQQVVIVPPVPQIVYRDWQGYIKSGQYNRPLVPKVERGGVDIRDDNDVTYSISTTGSIAATVNNTTGSADKGKITATDGSSGSIILTVTVAGVSFPTFTIPFTNQDDNPPTTGGGGSGNTGGSDSTLEDVTSTSFATITQQDGGESVFLIDITSGQTLNGTAPLTYQKSGSNTTATALTGKWQYRLQGDPTWLDFTGSAITGSGAYWNDVDFAAETGDATVNQSKASLATGTYEVQLVAAKSNSAAGNLQIISGTATVSRT